MSQDRWGRTQHDIYNPTLSEIDFGKTQTLHPPFSDGLIKPPEEEDVMPQRSNLFKSHW